MIVDLLYWFVLNNSGGDGDGISVGRKVDNQECDHINGSVVMLCEYYSFAGLYSANLMSKKTEKQLIKRWKSLSSAQM